MSSHDDKPQVPAPSIWPIGFAVGVVCLLVGFVVSWWGVAIGGALVVVFGFLWVYDLTRGMREPENAPESCCAILAFVSPRRFASSARTFTLAIQESS